MIGYREFKRAIKFYIKYEDRDCYVVYTYPIFGNKRRNPERIFKYWWNKKIGVHTISLERFDELKDEIGWFER